MLYDQMVADAVEFVRVQAGGIGRLQALIQLKVKDEEPQPKSGTLIFAAGRQPHAVGSAAQNGLIEPLRRRCGRIYLGDRVTCHGSLIRCDSATRWK
jgi:hypothetical protein